ncbi:MAG TPA: Uma2 family endonuclease [Ktedonobacteraceae bacterium]|nr:Uma2 family endonuclease [Ktedonobacteraceae bacterium]
MNPQWQKMSVEEYFQLDSSPSAKYEYIDGYAVAMSGGSVGHEWIAKNLVRELDLHLQAGPCQAHTSDMKVLVPATGSYFLPDASVSCDANDNDLDAQAIRSPRLIIEVLSPSTEAIDRGYKFQWYQTLPSLQEYVLVSSRYQFVEIFRRQLDDTWSYQAYRPSQIVMLESVQIELTFAKIYYRVQVPAKPELLL